MHKRSGCFSTCSIFPGKKWEDLGKELTPGASSDGPDASQVSPSLNRARMSILLYEQCSTTVRAQGNWWELHTLINLTKHKAIGARAKNSSVVPHTAYPPWPCLFLLMCQTHNTWAMTLSHPCSNEESSWISIGHTCTLTPSPAVHHVINSCKLFSSGPYDAG